jgi:uncharacterized protein YjiS (DUF1127 family)
MSIVAPDIVAFSQACPRSLSHPAPWTAGWLRRIAGEWRARIRERHELATLDERDMRDLGLSRWQVERELAKPFWRE